MKNIQTLAEETAFLLEKQEETKSYFEKQFASLFDLLEQKIQTAENSHDISTLEGCQHVHELLENDRNKTMNQLHHFTLQLTFLREIILFYGLQ